MIRRVKAMILLETVVATSLSLVFATFFFMQMVQLEKGVAKLERKMSFLQKSREARLFMQQGNKKEITYNGITTKRVRHNNEEKITSENEEFEFSVTFLGEK